MAVRRSARHMNTVLYWCCVYVRLTFMLVVNSNGRVQHPTVRTSWVNTHSNENIQSFWQIDTCIYHIYSVYSILAYISSMSLSNGAIGAFRMFRQYYNYLSVLSHMCIDYCRESHIFQMYGFWICWIIIAQPAEQNIPCYDLNWLRLIWSP